MTPKRVLATGAIFAGLAVILGAFGAHGLEDILIENGRLDTYQTATQYHMYHSLGMILLGAIGQGFVKVKVAPIFWLWAIGLLFFSGSLYTLAISNITVLGAVAPIGGLAFILGWALLAWKALKS